MDERNLYPSTLPLFSLSKVNTEHNSSEYIPLTISANDLAVRERIAEDLRKLPDEAFTRLQYIQGSIGCAHGCAFCSQGAGGDITQFTGHDISNLMAATKIVAQEVAGRYPDQDRLKYGLLGYDRVEHKPGVLFPYFDNDPFSYTHLDTLIEGIQELGCKVRISTVGYSRHNANLQQMHERIVEKNADSFSGIRFSLSLYPRGWRNPEEYRQDFANMLATYKPVIDHIGFGKEEACVELRFSPHLYRQSSQIDDINMRGRHVIHVGSHLLISAESDVRVPNVSVVGIEGRSAKISQEGTPYYLVTSDTEIKNGDWESFAGYLSDRLPLGISKKYELLPEFEDSALIRKGELFQFQNGDGLYYAFEPTFDLDGTFQPLHIYARTETRNRSGYLDTSRYLLNALLDYRREKGLGRRESFLDPTWNDVDIVINRLQQYQEWMSRYNISASKYIEAQVMPLISSYRHILALAGFHPEAFFGRFTVDTGTIVNQGRALTQFSGLVSQNDMPLTPQEERGYGDGNSVAAGRGRVWRWAPVPFNEEGEHSGVARSGLKNFTSRRGIMNAIELDYHSQTPFTPEGEELAVLEVDGFELEQIKSKDALSLFVSGNVK